MPTPVVTIVGHPQRPEMRAEFEGMGDVWFDDLAALEAWIAQSQHSPDLVIVCESWPDEFPADQITRLLTIAPLARIVCVYGAWCESAGRTRSHWPPGLRVPVWSARTRIEHELRILVGELAAAPVTATREEVLLELFPCAALTPDDDSETTSLIARVEIFDTAMSDWLTPALQSAGWTVTTDDAAAVSLVVVQADPVTDDVCATIATRCQQQPVLALTTWPLPEWSSRLRAAGADDVVNPLDPMALDRVLCELCAVAT